MTRPIPVTSMTRPRLLLWSLAALAAAGVALFSYRYLTGWSVSPQMLGNLFARPWLMVHAGGAATALLLAPLNLLPGLRAKRPGVHRVVGRVYVAACLVGALAGFILSWGSWAGWPVTLSLGSLAAVWAGTNVMGWRTAVQRRFAEHRVWMIRSFALTFAAVTFRIDLLVFPALGLAFPDAYRLTCFHSWMLNLLVAELYLRGAFRWRPAPRAAAPAL